MRDRSSPLLPQPPAPPSLLSNNFSLPPQAHPAHLPSPPRPPRGPPSLSLSLSFLETRLEAGAQTDRRLCTDLRCYFGREGAGAVLGGGGERELKAAAFADVKIAS